MIYWYNHITAVEWRTKNRICNSIVFDFLDVTHIYGYSKYPIYGQKGPKEIEIMNDSSQ